MNIKWDFQCVEFLKIISKGFNPITGEKLSEADILRASDVSGRLEDLVRELEKDYTYYLAFGNSFNSDTDKNFEIEDNLTISRVAENINQVIPLGKTRITKRLTKFLIENGYLAEILQPNQKRPTKLATKKGEEIGISNVLRQYGNGNETLIAEYSISAQRFLYENLRIILND